MNDSVDATVDSIDIEPDGVFSIAPQESGKSGLNHYRQLDWLNKSIKELIDTNKPIPNHINKQGNVCKEALSLSIRKVFPPQRKFYNFYQLQQAVQRYAGHWGFEVSIRGKYIQCCSKQRAGKQYKSQVSPSKQRKTIPSHKECDCPFRIQISTLRQSHSSMPEALHNHVSCPVRVGHKSVYDHDCQPGMDLQIISRQAAGRMTVPLEKVSSLVDLVSKGHVPTRTIRSILRPYFPDYVHLSSTTIHNFKMKAKLYNKLSPSHVNNQQIVNDLLSFTQLDVSQFQSSELRDQQIKEVLGEIFNESGWDVLNFVQKMKLSFPGFDYRIHHDSGTNDPIGIVWMTPNMKCNWKQYGETLFLDMQKREVNKFGWAYFGPTMLDCEDRIVQAAESLVIEETISTYAFVMNSIAEMEPLRPLSSVSVMFGDCFLDDSLLVKLDIDDTCTVVWDHYHLIHQVWPNAEKLDGKFDLIKPQLEGMLYAKTQQNFDDCYLLIQNALSSHPSTLDYLKHFHDHQKKFASFHVRSIVGNLGKLGSSHAEQNHSSIVAFLGKERTNLNLVDQMGCLLQRQNEKERGFKSSDRKYLRVVQFKHQDDAYHPALFLSQKSYENRWLPQYLDSNHYTVSSNDNGSFTVKRNGKQAHRILQPSIRCSCVEVISFHSQCKHEIARDRFIKGNNDESTLFCKQYFSPRHYLPTLYSDEQLKSHLERTKSIFQTEETEQEDIANGDLDAYMTSDHPQAEDHLEDSGLTTLEQSNLLNGTLEETPIDVTTVATFATLSRTSNTSENREIGQPMDDSVGKLNSSNA